MRSIVLTLFLFVHTACSQEDPCENHGTISDPGGERGARYGYSPGDSLKCDSVVKEGWYRMNSPAGTDIPTSCVEPLHCSTAFPVWINGELPGSQTTEIQSVTAVATGQTCSSPPTATWEIQVKSCGSFRVYYLRATPSCPLAYCFGTTPPCPTGTNSETGKEPGCAANFPDLTQTPTVDVKVGLLIPGNFLRTRQIQFTCTFTSQSDLPTGIESVDVLWYHDTVENEIGPFNVPLNQLPHVLNETHWETRGKVGQDFWCKVRVRGPSYESPSFWVESNRYYAGVKINNNRHVIVRGEKTVIQMQMTVPILGLGNGMNLVVMIPTLYQPEHNCVLEDGDAPFAATDCGIRLPIMGEDESWEEYKQETLNFTVFGKIEFELDRPQNSHNFIIRFERQGEYFTHPVWGHYSTYTTVSVTRSSHHVDASASCYSDADPSTKSFDRCFYRPQIEGEFVMYKHRTMVPVQVNVYYQRCTPSDPATCVCGVAILSGEEVFIFDQCRVRGRSLDDAPIRIGLLDCSEKSMDIRVIGTNEYKITLPTGAEVKIIRRTASSGITYGSGVYIQPSVKDVSQVEGLCGDYDGVRENDFIHRYATSPTGTCGTNEFMNDFVRSWRVTDPTESLYNGRNTGIPGASLIMFCRCPHSCPIFNCEERIESRADCTFDEFIERCRRDGQDWNHHFREKCEVLKRRKRSTGFINDDLSDMERPSFLFDPEYEAPPPEWRNGWTEERARTECQTRIFGGPLGSSCSKLNAVGNFTDAVDSCIEDIKISGSTEWISVSEGIMRGACESMITRNMSLWTEPKASLRALAAPPREFTDRLCPDDCNGRGTCHDETCLCEDGYGAMDCSVDLRAPPNITGTARGGVCDTSTRPCRETPVYGSNFADSPNVTCNVRAVKVWLKKPVTSYAARKVEGEYMHVEEVLCPLPPVAAGVGADDDALLATYHYISVSNDGTKYSGETLVMAYHAGCISCTGDGACNIRANTCYISGTCYASEETNPSNPCLKCDPGKRSTAWSPGQCTSG